MLEGLEITEFLLSELNTNNDRFRFDAEFVKKEYLHIESKLKAKSFKTLSEVKIEVIHPTEIKRDFVDDGIWFFRTQNLRPLKIENSNDVFISNEDVEKLSRNILKYADVLMTRTGANYGQTAIYNLDKKAIASSHVLIFRNNFFNQYYLAIFFNTKYGRMMIDKGTYGAAQPEISPYYILNIPIPIFAKEFQKLIEGKYRDSERKLQQSKQLYTQAENLLLQEIGLQNFTPSSEAVNIKNFKESFSASGRLDAEYYQPKYEALISKIKNYKNGFYEFDYFIDNFSTGFAYKSETYLDKDGVPLIRINNIGKGILDLSNSVRIPLNDLNLSSKDIANENDVLISMSGTIGNSCKVPKNVKAVVNQRIMRVTPKNINTDVLPILINSIIGQYQLERIGTGGVQTNISGNDIKSILIPNIEKEKQEQIAQLVAESFRLKQESENLLEVAKQAVEIAIEQNEETAMKFLKEKT